MQKVFYQTKEDKSYYENKSIQYDMIINQETGIEPVTVEEAKAWALIDTSADDTQIGYMITSVRQALETYLSRDIVAKNRTLYIEYQGSADVILPFAPINDIVSVVVGSSNTVLVADSDYFVRGVSDKRIEFASFPKDYVRINYTTEGILLQNVKDAIKASFEYLYDSRGLVSQEKFKGFYIPDTAKMLVKGQRTMFL